MIRKYISSPRITIIPAVKVEPFVLYDIAYLLLTCMQLEMAVKVPIDAGCCFPPFLVADA